MTTTQTTPDLDIIIRIEKLFAKANDSGASPAEQEAFQAKAFELMERHRINETQLGGHLKSDDVITQEVLGDFNGIYGRVRISVVNAIATHYDVNIFWTGYQNSRRLKAFGFKSDIDRVRDLANRLLADTDLRVKFLNGETMKATIRERRGFYMGYADEISHRLHMARRDAEEQARIDGVDMTSVALVLVDKKKQVNDQYRSGIGAKMKSAGGIGGSYGAGYQAGGEAGRSADLTSRNAVGNQKALGR